MYIKTVNHSWEVNGCEGNGRDVDGWDVDVWDVKCELRWLL